MSTGGLGVEPVINGTSTCTINGGSYRLHEVIAVAEQAALLGGERAIVSSVAAGAVTCGAAACVTGGDPKKMRKLPNERHEERVCRNGHAATTAGRLEPQVYEWSEGFARVPRPPAWAANGPCTLIRESGSARKSFHSPPIHRCGHKLSCSVAPAMAGRGTRFLPLAAGTGTI